MTLESKVQKRIELSERLFEERMLVITARDSVLHRLNEVGTFIWKRLGREPMRVSALCEEVAGHFDGCGTEEAERDTVRFLRQLAEKGLVEVT